MLEILRAYGADVDGAMQRMMNDEDFYAECIRSFSDDKAFICLKQAIDNADYKAAFENAHTLKGVASNLGLTPVYEVICSISEPLRCGKTADYESLYRRVAEEKSRLAGLLPELTRE